MNQYVARDIPASDLRAIALLAAESLKNPADYSTNNLSTDRAGNPVSVFSQEAVICDPIGHIYRAAVRHFGIKVKLKRFTFGTSNVVVMMLHSPGSKDSTRINAALNLLDAQVRYLDIRERGGDENDVFAYRGIVTIGHLPSGRETLVRLLEAAASRLEGGNEMIVSMYDVGVQKDVVTQRTNLKTTPLKDDIFEDEDDLEEDEVSGC